MDDGGAVLTPAQRDVIETLFAPGSPRPQFPPELGRDLAARLDDELGALAAELDKPLVVAKSHLNQVHACEAHYQHQTSGFSWNAPMAAGSVAHKAIELTLGWRGPLLAMDLVDSACERLIADDRSVGDYLAEAAPPVQADVRTRANTAVAAFLECWPALPRRWRPRAEVAMSSEVAGGKVRLRGKADLALGAAEGSVAKVLIVDLKTGDSARGHLDDLRFYALIQTLRVGVPPFRVATYYLSAGRFQHEDVTLETLAAALRRTVAGAVRMIELERGRTPTRTAGPQCRWCLLRPDCPAASEYELARDDHAGGDDSLDDED